VKKRKLIHKGRKYKTHHEKFKEMCTGCAFDFSVYGDCAEIVKYCNKTDKNIWREVK